MMVKGPGKINSRLARRLGLYVILASTLITLFTSGIQLFTEFRRDTRQISTRLDQIEKTQLSSIAERLWELDTAELETTLKSILGLPSIRYIAVYDYQKLLLKAGHDISEKVVVRKYPLVRIEKGASKTIGLLVIKASLDEAYGRVVDRAVIILATNAAKTFIVAGLILFFFYWLVARHLGKISSFARGMDEAALVEVFSYNRKPNPEGKEDELDVLASGISRMQINLGGALKEARDRESDLRITMNSIGDAVIKTDKNGCILKMNPTAERMLGSNALSSSGVRLMDFLAMDEGGSVSEAIDTVLRSGKPVRFGGRLHVNSGEKAEYSVYISVSPVHDAGEINGAVVVLTDFTEEKRLRDELDEGRRELAEIMDNAPSLICVKDREGYFSYINPAFEKVFSVSSESFIGKTLYDIFPVDVAAELYRHDKAVLVSGCPLDFEEHVYLDGASRMYSSHKFPMLDECGHVKAICTISTDMTDKKIQEEQLRRSQKMDALGKLTGGLAHDYNNMLGVILGYADLLQDAFSDNEKLSGYIEQIKGAGDRGRKLTRKLLSISKTEQSEAGSLIITDILHDDRDMLEKTLTSRISLKLDLESELWSVWLDAGDLEDAILNIMINAMHAIEDTGNITVRTRNRSIDKACAGNFNILEGDYVVLSVEDDGCGMDEETVARIFDPFFTTKGERGTGLGLSQVYGFVRRSGGVIDVSSEAGHGSVFSFYFPRYYASADEGEVATESEVVPCTGKNATILVVDDEPALVKLAFDALELHGFRVFGAYNAKQALTILDENMVDIMISDVVMPEMNGFQLASIVRKKYPEVKVQMVSGYSDGVDYEQSDVLVKSLMCKPFSISDLLKRVNELMVC